MLHKTLLCLLVGGSLTLVACANESTTASSQKASHLGINSCDDGVDACNGDERCISCFVDGGCADGPDPVWTGTACVCVDNDPANCIYTFCCAEGYAWNVAACDCLPCGTKH